MNFINRHRHAIIITWIIGVLCFTYFINKFTFENNSSILFLSVLFIVPSIVLLISFKAIKQNKQKYLYSKTNYYELIKLNINNELVKKLKDVTRVIELSDEYLIGNSQRLVLSINKEFSEIYIKNTGVSFKFYYSKTFDYLGLYDHKGFEYQSTHILFSEIFQLINNLLSADLEYFESYKVKLDFALLKRNDVVLYEFKSKYKKNKYKITYQEIIRL